MHIMLMMDIMHIIYNIFTLILSSSLLPVQNVFFTFTSTHEIQRVLFCVYSLKYWRYDNVSLILCFYTSKLLCSTIIANFERYFFGHEFYYIFYIALLATEKIHKSTNVHNTPCGHIPITKYKEYKNNNENVLNH